MTRRFVSAAVVLLLASGLAPAQESDADAHVKQVVLHSQRLGAHGPGYNNESLRELAKKLRPEDIPSLLRLLKSEDIEVSAGAKFGLASQCEAAIDPVKRASEKPDDMRLAEEVMDLVAANPDCGAQVKQAATRTKAELDEARKIYYQKRAEELASERANDQRIQANALKLTDPKKSTELTFEERMEVFKRSVKAAGLEDPKTPEQKALYDRMYRTMVLNESDNKKKPN